MRAWHSFSSVTTCSPRERSLRAVKSRRSLKRTVTSRSLPRRHEVSALVQEPRDLRREVAAEPLPALLLTRHPADQSDPPVTGPRHDRRRHADAEKRHQNVADVEPAGPRRERGEPHLEDGGDGGSGPGLPVLEGQRDEEHERDPVHRRVEDEVRGVEPFGLQGQHGLPEDQEEHRHVDERNRQTGEAGHAIRSPIAPANGGRGQPVDGEERERRLHTARRDQPEGHE